MSTAFAITRNCPLWYFGRRRYSLIKFFSSRRSPVVVSSFPERLPGSSVKYQVVSFPVKSVALQYTEIDL